MKIEKWNYNGQEIDISILDAEEIEQNIDIDELEETKDLSKELEKIGENDDEEL